jgi:hypothetical protein
MKASFLIVRLDCQGQSFILISVHLLSMKLAASLQLQTVHM